MQDSGKGDPEKIRDLEIADPTDTGPNCGHCPDKGDKNKKNIKGGQKIIFQSELNESKGKVKDEIEDKRQNNNKRQFLLKGHDKNLAERNGNQDIQECPNRSEKRRGR